MIIVYIFSFFLLVLGHYPVMAEALYINKQNDRVKGLATSSSLNFKPEDVEFADKLRDKAITYTTDEIVAKYKELKSLQGKTDEGVLFEYMYKNNKTRPRLSVFVSSNMPIASLKAFSEQAIKLGATLVFKGLPNNSFQDLIELVSKISVNGEEGSMQLDDEAFTKFGITKVPAIVLVEEKSCREFQTCISSYDKLEGNVSIKAALEMFAKSGDTQDTAKEILESVQ
jgi:type-F conjugative transfer system pilin assembly protein TrbC